jgi:hypothetical protein
MRLKEALRSSKRKAKAAKRAALVGKKTALLGAGDVKVVRVKLNSTGRSLLMNRRELVANLRATQAIEGGTAVISSQSLTFKHSRHG